MKLYFKQRFFSWFDSYDIYYEDGSVAYTVEGKPSWGHKLNVLDGFGNHIATLKQQVFTFLPKFDIYFGEKVVGTIKKELSFLKPVFTVDSLSWTVKGNFMAWDYDITDSIGNTVATLSKEIFNFTDTYTIEVLSADNALYALLVTLAIDAEKCSNGGK